MPYDCQTTPGVPPPTLLNACMGIFPCLHRTPPCHLIPPTQVMPANPARRGQPKVFAFLAQTPAPGGEDRVQSVVVKVSLESDAIDDEGEAKQVLKIRAINAVGFLSTAKVTIP